MSAKLTAPGLLKIKVFWNKGYDVIISVYDISKEILLRESNYVVDVVMLLKFGNYNFYERSYHNLNFMRIWPEKSILQGVLLVQIQ